MKSRFLCLLFICLVTHAFYDFSKSNLLRNFKRVDVQRRMNEEKSPFLDALVAANKLVHHRFFFPGHNGGKYGSSKFKDALQSSMMQRLDLPELDELDNVHDPQSCLKESLQLTARLFGALQSWFLVNGSTSGIHIAMMTLKKLYKHSKRSQGRPDKPPSFLVSRDVHKSVFDGLKLTQSEAILLPYVTEKDFGVSLGIDRDQLEETVRNQHTQIIGAIFTRPSYQGLMTPGPQFAEMIALCHRYGIPVLVDEAHGAHLAFLDTFLDTFPDDPPRYLDALSCGADLVVQSTHKTLTSLTQTAWLHAGNKGLWREDAKQSQMLCDWMQSYYSMLTSTSPNALLLASLDATQAYFTTYGTTVVPHTARQVAAMKNQLRSVSMVRLLEDSQQVREKGLVMDPLRLTVQFRHPQRPSLTSAAIDELMCSQHGIYCELNLRHCITYALPIGLTAADQEVLLQAIEETNAQLQNSSDSTQQLPCGGYESVVENTRPSRLVTEEWLEDQEMTRNAVDEGIVGRLSGESIAMYPPGIATVLRGEQITVEHIAALQRIQTLLPLHNDDQVLLGNSDPLLQTILTCTAPEHLEPT